MARKKKSTSEVVAKVDGWENAATGLGSLAADKREQGVFYTDYLDQDACERLWRGDDICARIIETVPNEMMRTGWRLKVADDSELSKEVDTAFKDLNAKEVILSALHHANALPGAAIFLGTIDSASDLSVPLNEDKLEELTFLHVFTPKELIAETWYEDPTNPKYGQVETYRLQPNGTPNAAPVTRIVHESRLIRIPGVRTTRQASLNSPYPGWDDSKLTRVVRVVRDFQAAFAAAGLMIQDFSVPTLKLKNLANILKGKGGAELRTRAAALEMTRSIARVAILDAEEEFKRETTSTVGLPEMLDKLMARVAAAADMPITRLMGQSPGGLNATGESDTRNWFDSIASARERTLRPILERVYCLLFKAKKGPTAGQEPEQWEICFEPLWQLTDLEKATLRKTNADADAVYIQAGVLMPEEVAESRFGGDEYGSEISLDQDLRDEYAAAEEQQAATEEDQRQTENAMKAQEVSAKVAAVKAKAIPKKE